MFVDLHCHSQQKAYSHSFLNNKPTLPNSESYKDRNSVWHSDWPDPDDIKTNLKLGLTKFRQSDYRNCLEGKVKVVCASLYPVETGFTNTLLGKGRLGDEVINMVTEFGKSRINYTQKLDDYFEDLKNEYRFNLELNGRKKRILGKDYRYHFVKDYEDLELKMDEEEKDVKQICVINSIEGAHSLGTGIPPYKADTQWEVLRDRIRLVKQWEYPPFFITLAHHFYNEFCGHAKSLKGIVGFVTNQKKGLDEKMDPLGYQALDEMLSMDNGRRILIDVKHMSYASRMDYYDLIGKDEKYKDDPIPVIVSHGGVTGYAHRHKGRLVPSVIQDAGDKFNLDDINFYDVELMKVGETQGIFGIQLDERRIAHKSKLKKLKRQEPRKVLYYAAGLVWAQIQHIAEVLDRAGLPAWDIQALGSDFDGIVNPIDGYFTSAHFKVLPHFLLMHAHNYMRDEAAVRLSTPSNRQMDEEEIVDKFMNGNAMRFLERNFR